MRRTSNFEGGDGTDARKPAASAVPPLDGAFIPVGKATEAVVLRLRNGFPKIRVRRAAEGGEPTARLYNQRAGEEEPR